jgi:quercetin dioxygenase-like cupin family protein
MVASLGAVLFGLVSMDARAVDSLLAFDDLRAWRIAHLYAASDGKSYIEEIVLPSANAMNGGKPAYVHFNAKPQGLRIGRSKSGQTTDWHYAGDTRVLIIALQGDLVFDTGSDAPFQLRPGMAILAEDWTGQGHKSGCVSLAKPTCVSIEILLDANPKLLPLRDPPTNKVVPKTSAPVVPNVVRPAGYALDSLLDWENLEFFRIRHGDSASDGRSYIESISVPAQQRKSGNLGQVYFDLKTQAALIARSVSGSMFDWHYASNSRHLIIPLQGDLVFDTGDGKTTHLKAGEAIYAEDWTGKGHRSGCVATNAKTCLVIDVLIDPNPSAIPLRAPPE